MERGVGRVREVRVVVRVRSIVERGRAGEERSGEQGSGGGEYSAAVV